MAAIGIAQEFERFWTAYERHTPSGAPQWWFTKVDWRVSVYYFYMLGCRLRTGIIKVCSYFPCPAKIWLNGCEWPNA